MTRETKGLTFTVELSPDELLLLDGLCRAQVQSDVDHLKHAMELSGEHDITLPEGLFVARAVATAQKKGRLTCDRVSMVRCKVSGKRAEMHTPRRKTRDNPYKMDVEVPFSGYDLDRGRVVMQHHPRLGIAVEAFDRLQPILASELAVVKAELPEKIMGHPPKYARKDVCECPECAWQGGKHEMRRDRIFRDKAECPDCGFKETYARRFKTAQDRFVIVEREGRSETSEPPPPAPGW